MCFDLSSFTFRKLWSEITPEVWAALRLNVIEQSQTGSSSQRLCAGCLPGADFQPGLHYKPANLIQLYFYESITYSFWSNLSLNVK